MSDKPVTPESKFTKAFGGDLIRDSKVHLNVNQEVIIITGDRLELCLRKHLGCVSSKGGWITPASLFITFLATLCSSTFHDSLGIKAAVWEAMFILLCVGSGIWFLIAIFVALCTNTSLDFLLKEIKKISALIREKSE